MEWAIEHFKNFSSTHKYIESHQQNDGREKNWGEIFEWKTGGEEEEWVSKVQFQQITITNEFTKTHFLHFLWNGDPLSISKGDYEWTHILLVLQRRSRKPTRTKSEEKECMFYVSDVSSPHMSTNSERKTAFRFTLDMRVWHSRRYFNKTHSHWWLLWLNILTLLLWSSQYNGL